jgi:hypothetical protein
MNFHLKPSITAPLVAFIISAPPAYSSQSCIKCHADSQIMTEAGYPHLYVTNDAVRSQSGMTATCTDCHLGNGSAIDRETAHTGMGRILYVRKKGLKAEVVQRKLPFEFGTNPLLRVIPQITKDGKPVPDQTVQTILFQDRRRDTLSQDFAMMEKTCGSCHRAQFAEFSRSIMGKNAKQSAYKTWNDKSHGPHNCGVWFDGNTPAIRENTSLPFSDDNSALNQRSCNTCHVGCLDCHYFPTAPSASDNRAGMHTFVRIPSPLACYGGGRGQICHAGPEDRRRGAGYFGESFSNPEGLASDVHLKAGVSCLDCHAGGKTGTSLGHGLFKRQATCTACHAAIVKTHRKSLHKKLSCEACHITNVGGYQATFWGPGELAGTKTPFYKFKDFYGVMKEPILIRDQKKRWIPVKPFPMAVMNQKKGPDLAPGLHWRWPKALPDIARTDDAFGYAGTFSGLPGNDKAILWLQMDKMSHKYGASRPCTSCHALQDGVQSQQVTWEFSDRGAGFFSGSHTVSAGKNGLAILDMKADEAIEVTDGYTLSAVAPFLYLKDKWRIPGDFSLPALTNKGKILYEKFGSDSAGSRKAGIIHQ